MPEREWEEGFKIVEVIEVTGSAESVLCVVGAWPPGNKAVCLSTYRNGELVHQLCHGGRRAEPERFLVGDTPPFGTWAANLIAIPRRLLEDRQQTDRRDECESS
jgi:hypothetical protein